MKPEDPLKGVREFLWTLAAEQECPAAPGSIFSQRLCQLALSSLSLWFLWLPVLFAGSEARLTISDGTNHNGALKKI